MFASSFPTISSFCPSRRKPRFWLSPPWMGFFKRTVFSDLKCCLCVYERYKKKYRQSFVFKKCPCTYGQGLSENTICQPYGGVWWEVRESPKSEGSFMTLQLIAVEPWQKKHCVENLSGFGVESQGLRWLKEWWPALLNMYKWLTLTVRYSELSTLMFQVCDSSSSDPLFSSHASCPVF